MQSDRFRTLAVFCAVSLAVHIGLVLRLPQFRSAPEHVDTPREMEVSLTPESGPNFSPSRPANISRSPGVRGTRRDRHNSGGGSPAPLRLLNGHGGVKAARRLRDDLVFAGGGAGGAKLPRQVARLGGGGGQEILAVQTARAMEAVRDEKPGLGPGTDGGAGTGAGGGVGIARQSGVGANPDGAAALAALRPKAGSGLGAAQGASIGTTAPGGGHGTGAELPGTGGEGLGYGNGRGIGIGDGAGAGRGGSGDSGAGGGGGGRARGVPFGDLAGIVNGDRPSSVPTQQDRSIHVIYLLDVSMSMKDGDKLGQAKQALKTALSELKPTDSFNIVYFYEDVYAFDARLLPATAENQEKGRRFVDGIGLGPGTNLSAALGYALGQTEATDIFVLSDGEPNRGIEDPARLRKAVQEENRRRHARVSTLALGLGERFKGMELLKGLAQENEGTFRYVDLSGGARR